jgi:hypothetical protein
MPFAESFTISGSTLASQLATLPARITINTGMPPTKISLINRTQYGVVGSGFLNFQSAVWNSQNPTSTYVTYINAAGTALMPIQVTNGITLYEGQPAMTLGPVIVGTTITSGNPPTATANAHGLQTGDIVLMTNNVANKQLGGLYFSVTVTGANTFTIPISTVGFSGTETGFVIRRLNVGPQFYPSSLTISAITAAAQAVVSTTVAHGLTLGQKVSLRVPDAYGMSQANNVVGVITLVNSATSFTLGAINSSAFTAFAYPTAGGAGFIAASPAQVIPIGSGPIPVVTPPNWTYDTLLDATTNVQFNGFVINPILLRTATSGVVGVTANDIIDWEAVRGDV